MSQTSYQIDFNEAFAGMKGDMVFDQVDSFVAEGSDIPFGRGVRPGTDPERQVRLADVATTFAGIALHEHKEQSSAGVQDAAYKATDAVSVLRKGKVWMEQETSDIGTLAVGDPAHINVAIGGAELGKVTSVAAANIPTGGIVRKINTDLNLALVEINLP